MGQQIAHISNNIKTNFKPLQMLLFSIVLFVLGAHGNNGSKDPSSYFFTLESVAIHRLQEDVNLTKTDVEINANDIEQQELQIEMLSIKTIELKENFDAVERALNPDTSLPASCHEWASRGEVENGEFQIQPARNMKPFIVTCKFRTGFLYY